MIRVSSPLNISVQVLQRCYVTLIPTAAPNYVANYLSPSPDLYGPFWTLTTVIFALFVFSSLAASISSYLSHPSEQYDYNFQLLSIAVSLVYAYGLGFPALLWGALRYVGVTEWSLVEAIAVWGYGQFVWIPVAVCILSASVFKLIPILSAMFLRLSASYLILSYDGSSLASHAASQATSSSQTSTQYSQQQTRKYRALSCWSSHSCTSRWRLRSKYCFSRIML